MPTTLRIIEGPQKGSEFSVSGNETIIGRGAKAQIKLSSPDISWEHAIITRAGEDWMIENLSAHGTLLNDQKISGRVRIRPRDRIQLGDDTILRFESTDGPQLGLLGNPWFLRGGALAVVLALGAVVAFYYLQKPAPVSDWPKAFMYLSHWVTAETEAGRMSPDVPMQFANAR